MSAPGEDLRRSLLIPAASSPSVHSSASPISTIPLVSLRNHLQGSESEDMAMEIGNPKEDVAMQNSDDINKKGVFSLDDYLSAHKDEHDAHVVSREGGPQAPATTSKLKKPIDTPIPVPVGARSSKHTILLHQKYQALGIPQPVFTFGGSTISGWTVSVSFPGIGVPELQDLEGKGHFNSKQEAKEALSKTALAVLEELEASGKVKKARKSSAATPGTQQQEKSIEPAENYIGQLLGAYLNHPSPSYHHPI